MNQPPEVLWTKDDAAKYLKVTPRTVENFIERGLLTARYADGSRLVRLDAQEVKKIFVPKELIILADSK